MELFPKDEPGQAIFFSPNKIAAARQRQQEIDAQKEAEKLAKQEDKHRRAFEKEQKAQGVRDRKMARQVLAAQKREAQIKEKEEQRLQQQPKKQPKEEQPMLKMPGKAISKPNKRKAVEDPPVMLPAPKSRLGRNGRKIALPERFNS